MTLDIFARAAVLLFLPTSVLSSKMPSVVSVSTQIKIRDTRQSLQTEDPEMKKLPHCRLEGRGPGEGSLPRGEGLRKEYLDEFEQLKANLYVANRLLPKSDTFHRGIAFGAYNVPSDV